MKLLDEFKKEFTYPLKVVCDENTWIYCFKNINTGLIKIGLTTDIIRRLRTVTTISGCDIELVLAVELESGRDEKPNCLEHFLHEFYKHKRQTGEWFNLEIKNLFNIRKLFWFIEGNNIIDNLTYLKND